MIGKTLKELGFTQEVQISHVAVKEAVLPFNRFPGVDALLSPEMKSTGEVMGIDTSFGMAFAKSQLAAGQSLPQKGKIFISVKNQDKRHAVMLAGRLRTWALNRWPPRVRPVSCDKRHCRGRGAQNP